MNNRFILEILLLFLAIRLIVHLDDIRLLYFHLRVFGSCGLYPRTCGSPLAWLFPPDYNYVHRIPPMECVWTSKGSLTPGMFGELRKRRPWEFCNITGVPKEVVDG